jgi:hypothetical protein
MRIALRTRKTTTKAKEKAPKAPDKPAVPTKVLYLPEPSLEFAYGQKLTYPRDGLFLFGPCDSTAKLATTRFGVIGTPEGIRCFQEWSKAMAGFIAAPEPGPRSRAIEPQHIHFPGFAEAFHSTWSLGTSAIVDDLDHVEIEKLLHLGNRYEAIHNTVSLYVSRLVREANRLEEPPSFWFVVIPEIVYQLGRPLSKVPKALRTTGGVTISKKMAEELKVQPTLFGTEGQGAEVYDYAIDFRRQLKARLLKDRIVTQIVRETTLAPHRFVKDNGFPLRRIEHPSTIAWKLGTSAYYKGGKKPWQLADVRSGVCYVGLVYKRSELSADQRHACCAAQMFLSDGEGVVFRGALGPWFHTDTRQFHLDAPAAQHLIGMVIEEYMREHDDPPGELFIHATSAFTEDEWKGFQAACADSKAKHGKKTNIVCVQIREAYDDLKLYRPGKYPVIRGTALLLDQFSAYLWTSGYVPRLDTYMGPETPNPIYVRVHRGTSKIETVLNDILRLTKINFNTCLNNDGLPVTIRFANEVGDVLISAPLDSEPRLPFKFYI